MPKRVQYVQSYPVLTNTTPVPEDGRVVIYAREDGIHTQAPDGGSSGPLSSQNVFIGPDAPTVSIPYLWMQTLPGGDMTLWVEDGI